MALKTPNSFEAINIKFDDEFLRYYKANSIIFNSKSLVKIINTNKGNKDMEKTLAQQYVEKHQDEETTLLKKYKVINSYGIVTIQGIELICQVMLENKDIRNKIIEYLEGKNN